MSNKINIFTLNAWGRVYKKEGPDGIPIEYLRVLMAEEQNQHINDGAGEYEIIEVILVLLVVVTIILLMFK